APAPIIQSTWGATSLRSISPSFRNGVVIGGMTPVGPVFIGFFPFCFCPLACHPARSAGGCRNRKAHCQVMLARPRQRPERGGEIVAEPFVAGADLSDRRQSCQEAQNEPPMA